MRAWLFRIAHNEAVNVLRRRRAELPLVDGDLTLAPSAAEETTRRELAQEALAEVAQLPPRQRGALVLRELHGLGYGEIAAVLSVTEVNARQLVFAARSGVADSRAGRALPCELVRDAIETGDRRVQRRRPLRAHLRSCDDCRAYARVSHGRPRRAILALSPGGWFASWMPFLNGGAASLSGAGELTAPAKAAAIVAIAAAAGAAATHDQPQRTAAPPHVQAAPKREPVAVATRSAATVARGAAARPSHARPVAEAPRVVPVVQRKQSPLRTRAVPPSRAETEAGRSRPGGRGSAPDGDWGRDRRRAGADAERSAWRQPRAGGGRWGGGAAGGSGQPDQSESSDPDASELADPGASYPLRPDATSDTPGSSSPSGVS